MCRCGSTSAFGGSLTPALVRASLRRDFRFAATCPCSGRVAFLRGLSLNPSWTAEYPSLTTLRVQKRFTSAVGRRVCCHLSIFLNSCLEVLSGSMCATPRRSFLAAGSSNALLYAAIILNS